MKVKIAVLALTLVIILGLSLSQVQAASTPQYLGETTWTVHETLRESGPVDKTFSVTGGITRVGATYYLFQGVVANTGGDNPFFLSGGGNLINNQLIMTLSTSQLHVTDPQDNSNWRDTGVMQITLDATPGSNNYLSGNFYEIGHDYNTAVVGQTGFDQRFSSGTITRTGPSIPLTLGVNAPVNSLLLQ